MPHAARQFDRPVLRQRDNFTQASSRRKYGASIGIAIAVSSVHCGNARRHSEASKASLSTAPRSKRWLALPGRSAAAVCRSRSCRRSLLRPPPCISRCGRARAFLNRAFVAGDCLIRFRYAALGALRWESKIGWNLSVGFVL
jgi:hypothetical protein